MLRDVLAHAEGRTGADSDRQSEAEEEPAEDTEFPAPEALPGLVDFAESTPDGLAGDEGDWVSEVGDGEGPETNQQNPSSVPLRPTADPRVTIAYQGEDFGTPEANTWTPSPFQVGLAIWCDSHGISRPAFAGLRELAAIASGSDWSSLPETLDALIGRYEKWLPIPTIYQAEAPVIMEKQPTVKSKNRRKVPATTTGIVYYVDIINMIVTMLNCVGLRNRMHFGPAQLVDSPGELWHGQAWAQSILSCSGDIPMFNGGPLFPTDCIAYRTPTGDTALGRIKATFVDCREASQTRGSHLLEVQRLHTIGNIVDDLRVGVRCPLANELVLFEDDVWWITAQDVISRVDVFFDRDYRTPLETKAARDAEIAEDGQRVREAQKRRLALEQQAIRDRRPIPKARPRPPRPPPNLLPTIEEEASKPPNPLWQGRQYVVRSIVNTERRQMRSFRLSHPLRAEIELEIYGRTVLEQDFVNAPGRLPVISLPHLTFIDAFGVYRNMYRYFARELLSPMLSLSLRDEPLLTGSGL